MSKWIDISDNSSIDMDTIRAYHKYTYDKEFYKEQSFMDKIFGRVEISHVKRQYTITLYPLDNGAYPIYIRFDTEPERDFAFIRLNNFMVYGIVL